MSKPAPHGTAPVRAATRAQLEVFLRSAESMYDVRIPIALHDGTRALGRLGEGDLALSGGAIPARPTSVFFPQSEKLFSSTDRGIEMQAPPDKPLLVVGLTAQDANCLSFSDSFFGEGIADDIYWNKRRDSVVVVLSGHCGDKGAFLKMSSGNCDMEWAYDGQAYLVLSHSDKGRALAEQINGAEIPAEKLTRLRQASDALPTDDEQLIQRASRLLRERKVPVEFWQSVADRCIACTACNLACPTCTCFDMYDWQGRKRTDRHRTWDSCQMDGFMREASGHNPLGTEALRTRRRIHHKLEADPARWGQITCFLCGRCDAVCPVHIGIVSVCTEMVERYG